MSDLYALIDDLFSSMTWVLILVSAALILQALDDDDPDGYA